MKKKHLTYIILCSIVLGSCQPDKRITLAENLSYHSQAIEKQAEVYWLIIGSLLFTWITTMHLIYRRRVKAQKKQLISQQAELCLQQKVCSENMENIAKMQQKEMKLKETFFRGLSRRIFEEIEKGGNIILTDNDWEDIVRNANIIFDNFTLRLQQQYPELNKEDLRYCCMIKMQLSQSEISQIMHLEKDSVKKRLKRIRVEKMKADNGITLEEVLRKF